MPERQVTVMQIAIYGEQSDSALVQHLRNQVYPALEGFTNAVEKATLYWKSETLDGGPTRYGCCLHLAFFNHQTAETAYWDEDLCEAARRSADLAAKLAMRCCNVKTKPREATNVSKSPRSPQRPTHLTKKEET